MQKRQDFKPVSEGLVNAAGEPYHTRIERQTRKAHEMRDMGYSYTQIAKHLGVSYSTVRRRLDSGTEY